MAVMTYPLKINGNLLPQLRKYKVGRYKLYSSGDRNMDGELRTNFIGIFPKLFLEFAPMSAAEMAGLMALLDIPRFTVEYYERKTGTYKTGTFYAGDYDVDILDKPREIYDAFPVNLIGYSKET